MEVNLQFSQTCQIDKSLLHYLKCTTFFDGSVKQKINTMNNFPKMFLKLKINWQNKINLLSFIFMKNYFPMDILIF